MRTRLLTVALVALLLSGCAGMGDQRDAKGMGVPLQPAPFKMNAAQVAWEPNAAYNGVVRVVGTKSNIDKNVEKASKDLDAMYGLLREHVKQDVEDQLALRKVGKGDRYRITFKPIRAYYDQAGFGSGIFIEASVLDTKDGTLWKREVKADTGLAWFGAAYASTPDRKYVQSFSADFVSLLSKAGFFQ